MPNSDHGINRIVGHVSEKPSVVIIVLHRLSCINSICCGKLTSWVLTRGTCCRCVSEISALPVRSCVSNLEPQVEEAVRRYNVSCWNKIGVEEVSVIGAEHANRALLASFHHVCLRPGLIHHTELSSSGCYRYRLGKPSHFQVIVLIILKITTL